jgi:AcrR family transcriptional regulator
MVAERAGYTTAVLYHYFGPKKELFLAIHRESNQTIYDKVAPRVEAANTFVDKIAALFEGSNEALREGPEMAMFIATETLEARRNPELAEVLEDRRWQRLYASIVERGVQTGEVRKEDAVAVRGVLGSLVQGLAETSAVVPVTTQGSFLKAATQLFRGELISRPRSRPRSA